MTDAESSPMSRRDVWLTVALAVAKGEMTEPDSVDFIPAHGAVMPYVTVVYQTMFSTHEVRPAADTLRLGAEAARALNLTKTRSHPDGILRSWTAYGRDGWVWEVEAKTPAGTVYSPGAEPPLTPLAEQVVETIGAAR